MDSEEIIKVQRKSLNKKLLMIIKRIYDADTEIAEISEKLCYLSGFSYLLEKPESIKKIKEITKQLQIRIREIEKLIIEIESKIE